MISIITSIHNQYAMNRLYFEYLEKYTVHPFELIIIDNASTDESPAFFRNKGVKLITNDGNYSYPHCQNQGIAAYFTGIRRVDAGAVNYYTCHK